MPVVLLHDRTACGMADGACSAVQLLCLTTADWVSVDHARGSRCFSSTLSMKEDYIMLLWREGTATCTLVVVEAFLLC